VVSTGRAVGDARPRAGHWAGATSEGAWRAWNGWDALPAVALPLKGQRVVVVSAHPDDEVLALGGLLQRLGAHGCELVLVCASAGEASHPDSPTTTPARLAARRTEELASALARLGHAGAELVHLHLPDSRLGEHSTALADRLQPHLAGAALAVAPWSADGHPDHDVCGRAVRAAARELRLVATAVATTGSPTHDVAAWEYPVWAWHWAAPESGALPWGRARALWLSPGERLAKAEAIGRFLSQVQPLSAHPADAPPLPADVIAHFDRPLEVVFT